MEMGYQCMNDFQCMWSIQEYNCAMAVLNFSEKSYKILRESGYTDSDVRVARKHLMNAVISKEDIGCKGLTGVCGARQDVSPKVIDVSLTLDDYEIISDLKSRVEDATHFVDLVLYPVDRFGMPFVKYLGKDYSLELFEKWETKYGYRTG